MHANTHTHPHTSYFLIHISAVISVFSASTLEGVLSCAFPTYLSAYHLGGKMLSWLVDTDVSLRNAVDEITTLILHIILMCFCRSGCDKFKMHFTSSLNSVPQRFASILKNGRNY